MPSLMENVSIVSHAVRTLLVLIGVGGLGTAAWYGYSQLDARGREARRAAAALAQAEEELAQRNAQIQTLEIRVDQQQQEIDRLDTAMRLLKVDHRIARLSVVEQRNDPGSGQLSTTVAFQELDESGKPVGPAKTCEIPGDVVYLDSWVVKFEDKYVEQADLHRATSLVLFRRLFGERQRPTEGFVLDEVGSRPGIYDRGGQMSDFERQIWEDFWSVANDQARQQELGIRAAHGEAPSIRVEPGKSYRITLRSSGGLTVGLETADEPRQPAKPSA
jgi:hypothetical protein